MKKALNQFGISKEFCNKIFTVYNNIESTVLNNGFTTQVFPIERGVRQGDPLSPYLYIIATEIFANAIRKNSNIKGLHIGDTSFKVTLYADDTTLFLKNEKDLENSKIVIDKFAELSGLKINFNKTVLIGIGKWKNKTSSMQGFKMCPQTVRILGVYHSYNQEAAQNKNFIDRLVKVRNTLQLWKHRGLTLHGKTLILKTLGFSQLVYPITNLAVPEGIKKQIDKTVFSFLWDNKTERIARKVMSQDYETGGLKVPYMERENYVLKAKWVITWRRSCYQVVRNVWLMCDLE